MALKREDKKYRGYRIIANAAGAAIYADNKQLRKFEAKSIEDALHQAEVWIDGRYESRIKDRRAKNIGTKQDYLDALNAIKLNAGQRKMLIAHKKAPGRRLTAPQLASAAGWRSYSSANAHYGSVGKEVALYAGLQVKGTDDQAWTTALASYDEATHEWEMHEEVSGALDDLNIT